MSTLDGAPICGSGGERGNDGVCCLSRTLWGFFMKVLREPLDREASHFL